MKLMKHYSHNKVTGTRLLLRFLLALPVFVLYIINKKALDFTSSDDHFSFLKSPVLIIIWLFMMADFILRLFPKSFDCIGMKKSHAVAYLPTGRTPDKKRIRKLQFQALKAFLAYLFFNALYAVPYILINNDILHPERWHFLPRFFRDLLANFGSAELVVGTMLYYVIDIFFIRYWCLFRNVINKNRCCTTCRIYSWDSIMMVTPLLLAPFTLFSAPLILVALANLIRHEVAFYRHPEYFLEETNRNLQCRNCINDLCPRKKDHDFCV